MPFIMGMGMKDNEAMQVSFFICCCWCVFRARQMSLYYDMCNGVVVVVSGKGNSK